MTVCRSELLHTAELMISAEFNRVIADKVEDMAVRDGEEKPASEHVEETDNCVWH